MQVGIKIFPAKSTGAGVQTVTGIVDKDGTQFEGRFVLFEYGHSILDGIDTWLSHNHGMDDGNMRGGAGVGDIEQFGALKVASGGGSGKNSVVDVSGNAFFGGDNFRFARVTDFRVGEFDLTYTQNDRTGDYIMAIIVGGVDIDFELNPANIANVYALAFEPLAVLFQHLVLGATTGSGSNAVSGSGGNGYGWNLVNGNKKTSRYFVGNTVGGNSRYQVETVASALINATVVTASRSVSSFGPTSFTLNGIQEEFIPIALGGTNIAVVDGKATQLATPGASEVIFTGITIKLLILMSVGAEASSSVRTDMAQFAIGFANGNVQGGFWTAENANAVPIAGAQWLSSSSVLRFATPNAGATVFDAVASITDIDALGRFTITWSESDGVPREYYWLAIGEDTVASCPIRTQDFDQIESSDGDLVATLGACEGNIGSGIYILVPNLRHDTLYTTAGGDDTTNVKIPDPFAQLAFYGDEP